MTAADILVERLSEWNVDTIFGLPGDGINGIMEALRQKQETIRFVEVRYRNSSVRNSHSALHRRSGTRQACDLKVLKLATQFGRFR